ncbi:hypothetical protein B5C34_15570 [Pacificimonas flava]|uniref:Cytochrome c domain-containing protein n=2 Tax=Pacificimonas TaxID=1960290 RepID=A0A219B1A6_9SPHN|nr:MULTISPECIES: hypothetical protein [Pacificimonas]MBZ6379616.1 cytochrome C [Pacificimonas aurantium]OWV31913.1 hypothetical protein B5C34_15570 [Pacificimonas flava]
MKTRTAIVSLAALLATVPGVMAVKAKDPTVSGAPVFGPAQTQFVLRCGGCHGTLGVSPPHSVPVLRGSAGWFLCTAAGRDYIARLPNVVRVPLSDEDLAEVLNFVAFELGEGSVPAGAERFTAEEVARQRTRPLGDEPLIAYRDKVVSEMVDRCDAPEQLLVYGSAD